MNDGYLWPSLNLRENISMDDESSTHRRVILGHPISKAIIPQIQGQPKSDQKARVEQQALRAHGWSGVLSSACARSKQSNA